MSRPSANGEAVAEKVQLVHESFQPGLKDSMSSNALGGLWRQEIALSGRQFQPLIHDV